MPLLRDDLLNPIAGSDPGGQDLRGSTTLLAIEDARREDDDAPAGIYTRTRKTADWKQTIKLSGDALATKSKDLTVGFYLVEALLRKDGYAGFREGVVFLKSLIDLFWDSLYPRLDDPDPDDPDFHPAERRVAPVQRLFTPAFSVALRNAPITKTGLTLNQYKESQAVGTREAAEANYGLEAYDDAVAQNKTTAEAWDVALAATSVEYYAKLLAEIDGIIEAVESLKEVCDQRFVDVSPSFEKLNELLRDEIRNSVNQLWAAKGGVSADEEPTEEPPTEETTEEDWGTNEPETVASPGSGGTATVRAKAKRPARAVVGLEPADKEDAEARLAAIAGWLRSQDLSNPSSYTLLRGYRWGELRAMGEERDDALLEPAPTEVRQNLRRLSNESDWEGLLRACEDAVAMPCGRAWLDVQRYAYKAAEGMGYERVMAAIKSELKALLADVPELPQWTLSDDTPTANAETQEWIKEFAEPAAAPVQIDTRSYSWDEEAPASNGTEAAPPAPNTFELALAAAGSGRQQEALELLAADLASQPSGRGRFQTKLHLAQVCSAIGRDDIAHSLLEELVRVVDQHDLERWEASELVAQPLYLLWHCGKKLGREMADKDGLYARICRLDPVQALKCPK